MSTTGLIGAPLTQEELMDTFQVVITLDASAIFLAVWAWWISRR